MATGGSTMITQRPLCQTELAQEPCTDPLPITGYENMPLVSLEEAVEPLTDYLPDIQQYVQKAKEYSQNPADGLTHDESASIMLYTMAWEPQNECLYFVLNKTLRSRQRNLKPWFLYLKLFLNGLFRLPLTSCTVYRGVKLNMGREYVARKTITWWGFSSCTTAMKVLESETFLGQTGTRTMFIINCKSGRDIHKHSYFRSEQEVLLLATTQFEVIDYMTQGDLQIVVLEESQPPQLFFQPVCPESILNNKSNSSKMKHNAKKVLFYKSYLKD